MIFTSQIADAADKKVISVKQRMCHIITQQSRLLVYHMPPTKKPTTATFIKGILTAFRGSSSLHIVWCVKYSRELYSSLTRTRWFHEAVSQNLPESQVFWCFHSDGKLVWHLELWVQSHMKIKAQCYSQNQKRGVNLLKSCLLSVWSLFLLQIRAPRSDRLSTKCFGSSAEASVLLMVAVMKHLFTSQTMFSEWFNPLNGVSGCCSFLHLNFFT